MLKLIAQESYRALNMTKKINPEGLENGAIDVKKINEKSTVLMGRYYWFHYTGIINLFYQNLTFALGVNSCLDILHGLLFPFKF